MGGKIGSLLKFPLVKIAPIGWVKAQPLYKILNPPALAGGNLKFGKINV